jgi:tetratricopeptide (TPR) repeat protein
VIEENQNISVVTDPYPGPRPFVTAECKFFMGREKESKDIRDLLLSYQTVVLYSKSGSGKSSLVNAGVIPLLKKEGFEIFPVARVSGKLPPDISKDRISNIFAFNVMSNCLGMTTNDLTVDLGIELGRRLAGPDEKLHLLILDQFEELFTTLVERWRDRKPFFLQIQKLCEANKHLRLLFVIREDHLAELDPYAELLPNGLRIRYRLERLREREALPAIVVPMNMAGFSFQEGVAEGLVTNLRKIHVQTDDGIREVAGEFIEPMHLQVVCRNLWNNLPRERSTVTAADVQKFADVNEALSSFYDKAVALAALKAQVKEGRIRVWAERKLITPGGTRGLVYMGGTSTQGLPNEAVRVLEQEHVLWAEPRTGSLWYELTHDRLIGPLKASNRVWFSRQRRWKRIVRIVAACMAVIVLNALAFFYWKHRASNLHAKQDEDAYFEVSKGESAFINNDFDVALSHYSSALSLYTKLGDRGKQADIYSWIGKTYDKKNDYSQAVSAYQRALALHESLGAGRAAADDRMLMGTAFFDSGNYPAALENYLKALKLLQDLKVDDQQAAALREAGTAYRDLGEYKKAEENLNLSLLLYEKLKEPQPRQEARAKYALANLYGDRGDYDRAIPLLKQVQVTFRETGDTTMQGWATLNLGVNQFYNGNLTEAEEEYRLALALFKKVGFKIGQAEVAARRAQWYGAKHLCKESLESADLAYSLAKEVNAGAQILTAKRIKARAYLCAGALQDAKAEAQEALEMSSRVQDKWEEAFSLETLALVAEASGDFQGAIQEGQKAVGIYDAIGSETVYAKDARANLTRWRKRSGR